MVKICIAYLYRYQGDQSCSGNHVGTHLDAPAHLYKDKWTVDEIPASRFVAPGVVVDIRTRAAEEPNSNVTLADVTAWEAEHGRIPPAAIVIMCSGWADKYPDKAAVFGNDRDDYTDFHFPGFGVDAVGWLIEERGIVGIGVDSPSTDFGASTLFSSHVMAAEHNVYGLENMNRVCDIPPAGTMIYALPAMYKGASGAPARILAIWDNNTSRAGSHRCTGLLASWALLLYFCL